MKRGHPHREFQLMRSYAGLGQWDNVGVHAVEFFENCEEVRDELIVEAHLLAALAARQRAVGDPQLFHQHLNAVEKLNPNHPDVHYLRMIDAGSRFVRSLRTPPHHGSDEGWAMDGSFWPQGPRVAEFLREVTGDATLERAEET
jgi:hypothetical protein